MSQEWKDKAYAAVVKVAESMPEFTPDDIWESGLEKPVEARALGGIMQSVKSSGIIEKTGRVTPTRQKESHATDVTVWQSNIFKG